MSRPAAEEAMLDALQRDTFRYFLSATNPANGLVADSSRRGSPASIAAVGLALAVYAVGAERGFITRADAAARVLTTLRFFASSHQGPEPDSTGHRGFYYHFLDMRTGRRAWRSELSTIDTNSLLAGALAAASYFDGTAADEREIRSLAEALYRRADWRWIRRRGRAVLHGWKPERGFLRHRWQGYSEAILLYALALGSPTFPIEPATFAAWTKTYRWKKLYGHEFLYAGPLFVHQLSHVWIDFRGIRDAYMRRKGIDYFENSRRATLVQQAYAVRNPKRFAGYGEHVWGVTASDGPGPARRRVRGVVRRFYDYAARGVPYGPDDGTIAPWAVVASLPFAPDIVIPTLRHMNAAYPAVTSEYGYKCSFNPTFTDPSGNTAGWISKGYYGLDQGPVVLMIENYRSELLWRLMQRCPYVVTGLRRAGFTGGWMG
jgi:hypothetical protein